MQSRSGNFPKSSEMDCLNMPPSAPILLEALRGMEYSPGAAIADIIDNSIAAGAGNVHINFTWNGEDSWVSILDDGCGMSSETLCNAMKLGCIPVGAERKTSDLGRFGLGLKTSSLSQCRRLTVASVRNGEFSCLRWDLDLLAQSGDEWLLMRGPAQGSGERLNPLCQLSHGTLVLWELPDRLFPKPDENIFFDVIDEIEDHLAVTFHVYISEKHLRIFINGRRVKPRDPFMLRHEGTLLLPKAYLGPATTVQGVILPLPGTLTRDEYRVNGRPRGWTASQGFYLYRNDRLVLAGSWLKLPGLDRDPFCNLARIRVDIPNSTDSEWKIDIRKSTARPPADIRDELVLIAKDVRKRARAMLLGRKAIHSDERTPDNYQLWLGTEDQAGGFRINTSHPLIAELFQEAGSPLGGKLRRLFKILEQTIPVTEAASAAALSLPETQTNSGSQDTGAPPEAMKQAIGYAFRAFLDRKLTVEQVRRLLCNMSGFNKWKAYIETLEADTNE